MTDTNNKDGQGLAMVAVPCNTSKVSYLLPVTWELPSALDHLQRNRSDRV